MKEFFRGGVGRSEPSAQAAQKEGRAIAVSDLAAAARHDWESLLPRLVDAVAALERGALAPPDAIVVRMLVRATHSGVLGLSWLDGRSRADVLVAEGTSRIRKARRLAVRAHPVEVPLPPQLPPELEKSVAAFTAASESVVEVTAEGRRVAAAPTAMAREQVERSTIALFVGWVRGFLETLEQIALAAAGSPRVAACTASVHAALADASVRAFDPSLDAEVSLADARIVEHVVGAPGRVVRVDRSGIGWRGQVLRKAEVAVGEMSPQGGTARGEGTT